MTALLLSNVPAALGQTRANQPHSAAVESLRLTSGQQARIRGIIQSDHRAGLPTLATHHDVLEVLTPAQRARLSSLPSPRQKPL